MLSLGASQNSGTPDQVRGDEWGLLGVQVRSDGRAARLAPHRFPSSNCA